MKSFKVEKRKIKKLWELINQQERYLDNPNWLKAFLEVNHINEPIITILETEYEGLQLPKPGQFPLIAGSRTDVFGEKVGIRFNHEYQFEIDFPEHMLPFLNFNVIGKTIPNSEFLPMNKWDFSLLRTNQIVEVNNVEIYNGIQSPFYTRYTQEDIDDGRVLENALKNAYFISVGAQGGFLNRLVVTFDQVSGTGNCSGEVNRKVISIDYNVFEKHRVTFMDTNRFEGIGNLVEFTYNDNGLTCEETINTITDKGFVSLDWSQADNISLRVENSTGINSFNFSSIPDFVIESGNWLYFGADKHPPRVGFKTVSGDDTLIDLPTSNLGPITVTPETHLTRPSVLEPRLEGREITIVELNEGAESGLKKYKVRFGFEAVVMSLATEKDVFRNPNEKLNSFTWDGAEYQESTSGSYSSQIYRFPSQDIQLKCLITIKNPFYYRTSNKVNINESI